MRHCGMSGINSCPLTRAKHHKTGADQCWRAVFSGKDRGDSKSESKALRGPTKPHDLSRFGLHTVSLFFTAEVGWFV